MNYLLRPAYEFSGDKAKKLHPQPEPIPTILDGSPSRRITQTPECPTFPIEQVDLGPESRVVYQTDPHGAGADRFRFLRMRLRALEAVDRCKSLLITSALPQDGKSTISLNLATALSEHGKRSVLLIEADIHHPTLTRQVALKPWPGLSDCLEGRLKVLAAIRRIEPLSCHLLPAGTPQGNPSELLQSDAMTEMTQQLQPHFDWIVMDAPPLTPLTDAMSLARHAHASLLVVRAGHTPKSSVEQAVTLLGPKHVVGIVLNGLEGLERAYSSYYGYSRPSGNEGSTEPKG